MYVLDPTLFKSDMLRILRAGSKIPQTTLIGGAGSDYLHDGGTGSNTQMYGNTTQKIQDTSVNNFYVYLDPTVKTAPAKPSSTIYGYKPTDKIIIRYTSVCQSGFYPVVYTLSDKSGNCKLVTFCNGNCITASYATIASCKATDGVIFSKTQCASINNVTQKSTSQW